MRDIKTTDQAEALFKEKNVVIHRAHVAAVNRPCALYIPPGQFIACVALNEEKAFGVEKYFLDAGDATKTALHAIDGVALKASPVRNWLDLMQVHK